MLNLKNMIDKFENDILHYKNNIFEYKSKHISTSKAGSIVLIVDPISFEILFLTPSQSILFYLIDKPIIYYM